MWAPRFALIPEEYPRASDEHGAPYQRYQPGLLKLADKAGLVVLVESRSGINMLERNMRDKSPGVKEPRHIRVFSSVHFRKILDISTCNLKIMW